MKKRWLSVLIVLVLLASPVLAEDAADSSAAETVAAADNAPQLTSAEMMGRVLDALGDEQYRKTYEYLESGETIAEGYQGDAGMGLQKMLVAFGRDIAMDGTVNAETMEALHQAESVFGLEPTDQVDLKLYEVLLPLVLLTREGDEAEQIGDPELEAYYNEAGRDGYYDYLKACVLEAQGKYYSAKAAFEACSYEGSAERAQSCVQPFPESGEIWRNPDIPGEDSSLTFIVKDMDDSQGMCFRMYNEEDQLVSVVFVMGNSSATAIVPTGTYHIMESSGAEWYGLSERFGPDGYYGYLTFSEDPETMYDAFLDYGQYELAINVEEIEEGATGVGSTDVGWDDDVNIPS